MDAPNVLGKRSREEGGLSSLGNPMDSLVPFEVEAVDVEVSSGPVSHPPIDSSLPSYEENEITPYVNPRRFKKYDKFSGGGLY